eukprot:11212594-Lingulodinium_polyedra.AAC.1
MDAWRSQAPFFAHQLRPGGRDVPKAAGGFNRQYFCSACAKWIHGTFARDSPCYAAAGFLHNREKGYKAKLEEWTRQLRQLWCQLKNETVQVARFRASRLHSARRRLPVVSRC